MTEPARKRPWTYAVHYRYELHRYLLRRLGKAQELDDLKQEIYLRLLRMKQEDCIREPLAYLYTVASSVVVDYTVAERHRDRVKPDSNAVEDWAEDPDKALPDDMAERLSLQRQMEKALKKLPALQAQALVLHYQEGLYCEEIAERLGLSVKSVDKYLSRAKASMRQMLWDF